jgi:iron complex transport system permease protein
MNFMEKRHRYKILFLIGLLSLGVLILTMSMLGVADISLKDGFKILVHRIPIVDNFVSVEGIPQNYINIIIKLRLPRIILAGLVGMGLSVSGAAFQGMFKNPMADPYVLGVSSGAALGATLSLLFGFGASFSGVGATTLMAFAGAMLTMAIVYSIAKVGGKVPIVSLILAGISVSYLLSSVISLMMIFNRTQIEKIIFWLMGSISAASWTEVKLLLPFVLIGTILISIFARDLNIMLTGDETAKGLGIEVEKVKKILLVITSLIVGASVSVSGIIGFVGLIVPHTVRLLIGPDNRVLIPFSAILGAIFLIVSDTIARTIIPPTEIPVGAITSVFGAPYFIYLLVKSKKVKR